MALPILIPAERDRCIEYLSSKFVELLDNKEGIKLAFEVINYSSPK
jgi:hypothetical protein